MESIRMINDSHKEVNFQFVNSGAIFDINPSSGFIKANSNLEISVTFKAKDPLDYGKDVFCIIDGQAPLVKLRLNLIM
jgi:hypothetical protein